MPNLRVLEGKLSVVSQNNHIPRKRFWVKRVKEIMDPSPIKLSPFAKPKKCARKSLVSHRKGNRGQELPSAIAGGPKVSPRK